MDPSLISGIRGIIFDMDGVILHSSPIHERAFRTALLALPVHDFSYSAIAGMRTDEALRAVLSSNAIPYTEEQIGVLAAAKSRFAREMIVLENPVAPRCAEILDRLARTYRLALASSASKETIDLFLARNRLAPKFECVVHGGEVIRSKPAPDIYRLCCDRMGLSADACLIVEDAVSGVRAGKSAGASVWAITTTSAAMDLADAGADRVMNSLEDLLELVEHP